LLADADFREGTSWRDQIAIAEKHLRGFMVGKCMTFAESSHVFRGYIYNYHEIDESGSETPRPPGGRSLLPDQVKRWLTDFLHTRMQERKPVTCPELLELFESQYTLSLCADTLFYIIQNMTAVKIIIGRSREVEWAAIVPDETHEWFYCLSSVVEGIPREFVFNVDETGCFRSQWRPRSSRYCADRLSGTLDSSPLWQRFKTFRLHRAYRGPWVSYEAIRDCPLGYSWKRFEILRIRCVKRSADVSSQCIHDELIFWIVGQNGFLLNRWVAPRKSRL
jgi:hypothetical protein